MGRLSKFNIVVLLLVSVFCFTECAMAGIGPGMGSTYPKLSASSSNIRYTGSGQRSTISGNAIIASVSQGLAASTTVSKALSGSQSGDSKSITVSGLTIPAGSALYVALSKMNLTSTQLSGQSLTHVSLIGSGSAEVGASFRCTTQNGSSFTAQVLSNRNGAITAGALTNDGYFVTLSLTATTKTETGKTEYSTDGSMYISQKKFSSEGGSSGVYVANDGSYIAEAASTPEEAGGTATGNISLLKNLSLSSGELSAYSEGEFKQVFNAVDSAAAVEVGGLILSEDGSTLSTGTLESQAEAAVEAAAWEDTGSAAEAFNEAATEDTVEQDGAIPGDVLSPATGTSQDPFTALQQLAAGVSSSMAGITSVVKGGNTINIRGVAGAEEGIRFEFVTSLDTAPGSGDPVGTTQADSSGNWSFMNTYNRTGYIRAFDASNNLIGTAAARTLAGSQSEANENVQAYVAIPVTPSREETLNGFGESAFVDAAIGIETGGNFKYPTQIAQVNGGYVLNTAAFTTKIGEMMCSQAGSVFGIDGISNWNEPAAYGNWPTMWDTSWSLDDYGSHITNSVFGQTDAAAAASAASRG